MTTQCARESCRQEAYAVVCIELVNGRAGREYDIPLCQQHGSEFRQLREPGFTREWHGGILQRDCWKCGGQGTLDGDVCPECLDARIHYRLVDRESAAEPTPLLEVNLRVRRDFATAEHERRWVTALATALGAEEISSQWAEAVSKEVDKRLNAELEIPF